MAHHKKIFLRAVISKTSNVENKAISNFQHNNYSVRSVFMLTLIIISFSKEITIKMLIIVYFHDFFISVNNNYYSINRR